MPAGDAIRAIIANLKANREAEALRIVTDLSALIRLRINTRGEDANGNRYAPYSPAYAKKRAKAGRQTSRVDFLFTGELQRATRPYLVSSSDTATVVEITARGADNQRKAAGALTKPKNQPRGNIFRPSADEITAAALANERRVLKAFGL